MKVIYENLIHYALTRGIIYGLKPSIEMVNQPTVVGHAPFTLQPYKYSRKAFDTAIEIAPLFNVLVDKVSRDTLWLNKILHSTAVSDDFTNKLLVILNKVEALGISQSLSLGIIRSDYMLHEVADDTRGILQVEINTIASSFGSLSTKISEMHSLFYPYDDIPSNIALTAISEAIAYAHHFYIKSTQLLDSIVIMVIQPNERNFSDQRHIHFELLEEYGITTVRLSLEEIEAKCVLDDKSNVLTYDGLPVSVVYVSTVL
jgi:glutathione synthase